MEKQIDMGKVDMLVEQVNEMGYAIVPSSLLYAVEEALMEVGVYVRIGPSLRGGIEITAV